MITIEDLSAMDIAFPLLEKAVNAQETLQEILLVVIGARSVLSDSHILKIITNVCIFQKRYNENQSLPNPLKADRDTITKMIDYQPTMEDIQFLQLSPELHNKCYEACIE